MKKKQFLIDFIQLILLLIVALVLIYYSPPILQKVLFLIPPILFYRSRRPYFWFAFLLIIIESPGGLFATGARNEVGRLPIYTITPGVSFTFEQFMIISAFLRAIFEREKFRPFFYKPLQYLFYYFILLIIISFVLGVNFDVLRLLFKIVINLSLFYSIYFLIKDEISWRALFALLFPFVFISFGLQLFSLANGYQLVHLFNPEKYLIQGFLTTEEEVIERPIELVLTLFVCFYASFFYLFSKVKYFSRFYLILINATIYISFWFTATRTWVIALSVSYLLIILLNPNFLRGTIGRSVLILSVIFLLVMTVPVIQDQFNSAFERLSTVEYLAKGDITAGGTLQRFSDRAPKVFNAYKESSVIFGDAFSSSYYIHNDHHVGYHNYLYNTGIIGSFLFLSFILNFLSGIIKLRRKKQNSPFRESSINILIIALFAILLIQVSYQFIGYDVSVQNILAFCFILYFSSTIYNKLFQHESNYIMWGNGNPPQGGNRI